MATDYTYNGFDDQVQLTSPDTGTATYGYDSAGNRTSQLDARGITTAYTYDVLDRLTGIDVPTDPDVARVYDTPDAVCASGETFGAGRLAKITDGSGSTRYCYDRHGRLVRKVQAVTGGSTFSVGATYDGAGNLLAMTYPSGAIVTYLRNANGQIARVDAKPTALAAQVTLVSGVTYAPFGPLTALTFGNGRQQFRAYDKNYGIDAITESGGTGGFTADYGLDPVGNLTGLTERGSLVRAYEYDGQDRLKAMKTGVGGTTLEAFAYDATGNRTSKTVGASTSAYTYVGHKLTNVAGSGARSYDNNGNTTAISTVALTYNQHNRLKTVTSGGVLQRTYAYNGKGERVLRTVHAGTEISLQFVYDEAGHLLGEYATNGTRVAEYVWMDDTLVGVLRPHDGTTYQYVATDHLGTPRAVINPTTNAVVWRADLTGSPFGAAGANSDADGNGIAYSLNLRFLGQYYDGLGLFYNYYRDYDAGTGRYLQSDPIGQNGGSATYAYVRSNSLGAVDPFGLLDIYIGGARDSTSRIVKSYYYDQKIRHPSSKYFEWFDQNGIHGAINAADPNEPINLIGHSLGGAAAVEIAAKSTRRIGLLISIDPVSNRNACFSNLDNVDTWIDVNAMHAGGIDQSDRVANAGGKWGELPRWYADQYVESPANHGDFAQMMLSPGPDGRTPQQILRGEK